jgi:hypothetical protein
MFTCVQGASGLMSAAGAELDAQIRALLGNLKAEGHIDDQFEQLLLLQDDSDPDFVQSVMQLFFQVRGACISPSACCIPGRGAPRRCF